VSLEEAEVNELKMIVMDEKNGKWTWKAKPIFKMAERRGERR
jgi:hypothetical protein